MIAKKTVTLTDLTATSGTVKTCYGLADTMAVKRVVVDKVSKEIVAFLSECEVSAYYDEQDAFMFLNGFPFGVRVVTATTNCFRITSPFVSSAAVASILGGNTTISSINVVLYFVGNSTAFHFAIYSGSTYYCICMFGGKNVVTGRKAAGIATGSFYSGMNTALLPYDLDENGDVVAGFDVAITSNRTLSIPTSSPDANGSLERYGKIPLRHKYASFYEFDGYLPITNFGFSPAQNVAQAQTVLEIDGENYVLLGTLGLVKL